MITVLWAKSLTMTKKFTFAVLASVMLAACQKETTPPPTGNYNGGEYAHGQN
jgi:uncharacterized lipoprotein YajG